MGKPVTLRIERVSADYVDWQIFEGERCRCNVLAHNATSEAAAVRRVLSTLIQMGVVRCEMNGTVLDGLPE